MSSDLVFVTVFMPGKIGLNITFHPKMIHLAQQADESQGESREEVCHPVPGVRMSSSLHFLPLSWEEGLSRGGHTVVFI